MIYVLAAAPSNGINLLRIITLLAIVIGVCIGIVMYFIPAYIAHKRNHIQKNSILLLNIFLGWTFAGWVVALIWAMQNTEAPTANMSNTAATDSIEQKMQSLIYMRTSGIITNEEFEAKKRDILARM